MTSTETLDLLDELLALFLLPFTDHCLNICDWAFSVYRGGGVNMNREGIWNGQ